MLLIPAIDLKDGKCVRLVKGLFDRMTVYGDDPAAMARRWEGLGAEWIHLVDLDASLGKTTNREAIKAIREAVSAKLQLGGGIKGMEAVDHFLGMGIDRVIMGTAIIESPGLVAQAARAWPGRIAAALDASGRSLRTWGWKKDGGKDLIETAKGLADMGVSIAIHTDVERDGTQDGPNVALSLEVAEASGLPTIVSGGIAGLADVRKVREEAPGLYGVITGKAIYAGTLDFREGLAALA
jgi:phosphoribosylformimino-5-aminoimidazole carboxamide ribotide isomerase